MTDIDYEAVAGRLMSFFALLSGVMVEAGVVEEGHTTEDMVAAVRSLLLERDSLRGDMERADLLIDGLNETVGGLEEDREDWQELAETRDRDAVALERALALERRTLIEVAALGDEYKHTVEHVASCGGTCEDCKRLAQSALDHRNLDTILENEYLAVIEKERADLQATVERQQGDLQLLIHRVQHDRDELNRLTATVRRTRRAARAFVSLALSTYARKLGVDTEGKKAAVVATEISRALDQVVRSDRP